MQIWMAMQEPAWMPWPQIRPDIPMDIQLDMGYPFGYVWINCWIGVDNQLDMLGEFII
jgi:hypothetical protein